MIIIQIIIIHIILQYNDKLVLLLADEIKCTKCLKNFYYQCYIVASELPLLARIVSCLFR
jgi:hypothetical protein